MRKGFGFCWVGVDLDLDFVCAEKSFLLLSVFLFLLFWDFDLIKLIDRLMN